MARPGKSIAKQSEGRAGEKYGLFEHTEGMLSCRAARLSSSQAHVRTIEVSRATFVFPPPAVGLFQLLFRLLLLNQAGQVCALELEVVCCFCLIALRFLDGSLDDVAAMLFHRLMVRE
jgi:hypothetical protein